MDSLYREERRCCIAIRAVARVWHIREPARIYIGIPVRKRESRALKARERGAAFDVYIHTYIHTRVCSQRELLLVLLCCSGRFVGRASEGATCRVAVYAALCRRVDT